MNFVTLFLLIKSRDKKFKPSSRYANCICFTVATYIRKTELTFKGEAHGSYVYN